MRTYSFTGHIETFVEKLEKTEKQATDHVYTLDDIIRVILTHLKIDPYDVYVDK